MAGGMPAFRAVQKWKQGLFNASWTPSRKDRLLMSKVLCSLLLLTARIVHAQLVRENEFLKVENRILRSRVKDKVVPMPEERAALVRFGRELGSAIKNIISIVHPITFAKRVADYLTRTPVPT